MLGGGRKACNSFSPSLRCPGCFMAASDMNAKGRGRRASERRRRREARRESSFETRRPGGIFFLPKEFRRQRRPLAFFPFAPPFCPLRCSLVPLLLIPRSTRRSLKWAARVWGGRLGLARGGSRRFLFSSGKKRELKRGREPHSQRRVGSSLGAGGALIRDRISL